MKTSCLRLKLVELNFLVSFNTDDQSKTDVTYTVNITTYYVFNKIIFDTLAEQYQIFPNENIQNIMSSLLQDIPVYNWKSLNWSNMTNDSNILEDTEIIYEMQLDDIL